MVLMSETGSPVNLSDRSDAMLSARERSALIVSAMVVLSVWYSPSKHFLVLNFNRSRLKNQIFNKY